MSAPSVDRRLSLGEIPPTLQRAWLAQLRRFYDLFNANYLRGRLRRPLFLLGESASRLGEWDGSRRTITISVRHILSHPWERVLDTLRHEMAHQYVEDVLGLRGAPPHGDGFREAAYRLRVSVERSASTEGLGSIEASASQRDRILARVKLLLALARSPNEHEASSAVRMANRYLLQYNLDLSRDTAELRYETRCLGPTSGRIQEHEYALGQILQDHFFVCVIWTWSYDPLRDRPGRVLQVSGTRENLEMAEYVYHYVRNVADQLWKLRRREEGARGGSRLQYLAGVLRGLKEKLDAQRAELRAEEGLVWSGDRRLDRYYRYVNPHIRNQSTTGVARGERYHAGLRDGRSITIHRGVGDGAARRGRLLPGS